MKNLLREWVAASVRQFLVESEIYIDENGYAHDDEGNTWYVGKGAGRGETFSNKGYTKRYGSPATSVPNTVASLTPQQKAAIQKLVTAAPGNNFVASIWSQVSRGRSLSPKQKAVLVRIMTSAGMATEAALFS